MDYIRVDHRDFKANGASCLRTRENRKKEEEKKQKRKKEEEGDTETERLMEKRIRKTYIYGFSASGA